MISKNFRQGVFAGILLAGPACFPACSAFPGSPEHETRHGASMVVGKDMRGNFTVERRYSETQIRKMKADSEAISTTHGWAASGTACE